MITQTVPDRLKVCDLTTPANTWFSLCNSGLHTFLPTSSHPGFHVRGRHSLHPHTQVFTYGSVSPHTLPIRFSRTGQSLSSRTGQYLPPPSHSGLHVRGSASPHPDPATQVFTYGVTTPYTLTLRSSHTGQAFPTHAATQVFTYGAVPPHTLTLRSSRTV